MDKPKRYEIDIPVTARLRLFVDGPIDDALDVQLAVQEYIKGRELALVNRHGQRVSPKQACVHSATNYAHLLHMVGREPLEPPTWKEIEPEPEPSRKRRGQKVSQGDADMITSMLILPLTIHMLNDGVGLHVVEGEGESESEEEEA